MRQPCTFEEKRAHLGVETHYNGQTKQSPEQPLYLMGLFSFITLVAFNIHQTKALVSMETASRYDKQGELTFSDVMWVKYVFFNVCKSAYARSSGRTVLGKMAKVELLVTYK